MTSVHVTNYRDAYTQIIFGTAPKDDVIEAYKRCSDEEWYSEADLKTLMETSPPEEFTLEKPIMTLHTSSFDDVVGYMPDTIDEVISLFKEGKINAFEIGNYKYHTGEQWEPIARIYRWGNGNQCSIKSVDYRGIEGSGAYADIDAQIQRRIMDQYLEKAAYQNYDSSIIYTSAYDRVMAMQQKTLGITYTPEQCRAKIRII